LKQPSTIYNATNPFPWMDMILLQGKTNFFEKWVSDYAKTRVSGPTYSKHHAFSSLDEQF
jgi:ribonucleoside-diphosphate reductase beta chain